MKKTGNIGLLKSLLAVWAIFCSLEVSAQELSSRASKSKVGQNETFQIFYTVKNGDLRSFNPPSLGNFRVLSGPNQSTSMQLSGGAMSREVTYSYYLQASKVGTFKISGASAVIGGQNQKFNDIAVEVVKGSVPQQNQNKSQQNNSLDAQIRENLFMKLYVDKKEVYQGEQVTAAYKLYMGRFDVANVSMFEAPNFNGFWTQEVDIPQQAASIETYKGAQYRVSTIKQVALFPQRSGELEIEDLGLDMQVQVPVNGGRRDPFNFFNRYRSVPVKILSNSVKINVKPLPTVDKPADFTGFVGTLSLESEINGTEVKTDDPINLKMVLKGVGNLRMIEDPKIDLPNDFEVFPPDIDERISSRAARVQGSKTYQYLIIPRRPGNFQLPPITLSYFDINEKKYKTLSTPEFSINVTGEASGNYSNKVTGINKEDIELLNKDIRYISERGTLSKSGNVLLNTWYFPLVYASPLVLFLLIIGVKRRRDKVQSDEVSLKRKRASRQAVRRLKKAKQLLDDQNEKEFYAEIAQALWGYLGDKLNLPIADLSKESVRNAMNGKNLSTDGLEGVFTIIENCEIAVYAPGGISGGPETVYDQAKDAIDKLESEVS